MHPPAYDLNSDNLVDARDREAWVQDLAGTYFGDANLNGEFNSHDLVAVFVAGEYEDTIDGNSTWATGDWDGDGDFRSGDRTLAFQSGGYEQGPRAAARSVPEPGGFIIWLMSICLVIARRTHGKTEVNGIKNRFC